QRKRRLAYLFHASFLSLFLRAVFFFFFQAEDGIRAFHVTGVQTCALPISWRSRPGPRRRTPAGTGSCPPFPHPATRRKCRPGGFEDAPPAPPGCPPCCRPSAPPHRCRRRAT